MHYVTIIIISKKSILVNYLGWWTPIGVHTVTCIALLASLHVDNRLNVASQYLMDPLMCGLEMYLNYVR